MRTETVVAGRTSSRLGRANTKTKRKSLWKRMVETKSLWLLLAPGLILVLVFNYGPMYGVQIAFREYRIGDGIWDSEWVGLLHFQRFFTSPVMLKVLRNTVEISLLRLVFGFPAPIILALLLDQLRDGVFKRTVQTISYLPYFISWIVIASMVQALLSPGDGVVNQVIRALGGRERYFMIEPQLFRPILIVSDIWKGVGWGAVIYLAALSGVSPEFYEAAVVDGASRIQRIRHISVPAIMPVVTVVLILSMGGILNAGFDQIFNMYNIRVYDVADIIDTFVYRYGIAGFEYFFAAAVGLFKSVVGLVLVLLVNTIARRIGEGGGTLW